MQENLDALAHKVGLLREVIAKGPAKPDAVDSISWATDQLIAEALAIVAALLEHIHENAGTVSELEQVKRDVARLKRDLKELKRQ